MSDYSEEGAVPVEDAAVDDPPTETEVRDKQKRMEKAEGDRQTVEEQEGREGDASA